MGALPREESDSIGNVASDKNLTFASPKARGAQKKEIWDKFVPATGYYRKNVLEVLLPPSRLKPAVTKSQRNRERKPQYGIRTGEGRVSVWKTAYGIGGKRLAPFLLELLAALERHGQLTLGGSPLEAAVREPLLNFSAATIDRLLHTERKRL